MNEPGLPHVRPEENSRHGRLTVRPYPPVSVPTRTGLLPLEGPAGELLALNYVPAPVDGRPYRLLLLLLHGAGGSPRQALDLLLPVANEHRLLLVAPKSAAEVDEALARAGMRAVFDTLREGIAPSEYDDVISQLPAEFWEVTGSAARFDGQRSRG